MKKKFNEIRVFNIVGKFLAKYKGNGDWDLNSGEFKNAQFEFVYKTHKDSIMDWYRDSQWIMKSRLADRTDNVCFPMTMNQFLECLSQTEISDNNIILFDNYKASTAHNTVPYETGKSISYEQLVQIAREKFIKELEDTMANIYQENQVAKGEELTK